MRVPESDVPHTYRPAAPLITVSTSPDLESTIIMVRSEECPETTLSVNIIRKLEQLNPQIQPFALHSLQAHQLS